MTKSKENSAQASPRSETQRLTADERKFLSGFLDELEREDPAAAAALLESNPQWVEYWGASGDLRGRVWAALTGQSGTPLSPEQKRLIERTRASRPEYDVGSKRTMPDGVSEEPAGILTSLMRRVPPEKAIELYRKITPVFVYQVLTRLNESASLRTVNRIVEHLCGDEAQLRLRECEHVRDGILDEFRSVLGRSEIGHEISREDLQRLLEECGALNDLIVMENCIKLAAAKAG